MCVDALLRRLLAADCASDPRLVAARLLRLNRRTLHGTERAEDAAVAPIGTKQHTALRALVVELACVGRHELRSGEAAEWTGQHGNEHGLAHVIELPSLHGLRRKTGVRRRFGERLDARFGIIERDDRLLRVVARLDLRDAGHPGDGLPDRDRA